MNWEGCIPGFVVSYIVKFYNISFKLAILHKLLQNLDLLYQLQVGEGALKSQIKAVIFSMVVRHVI